MCVCRYGLCVDLCFLMSNYSSNVSLGPRIASFNSNGLGNAQKRKSVLTWLKSKPEDVIFVQETHSTPGTERDWKRDWGGEIFFNHGASNSTGVAILVKNNTHVKIKSHRNIGQGRVILLEVECDSVNYCLVNLYSPNNDDLDFIKSVFLETLGRARDDFVIMAGDWNTVLNNGLDKMGGAQAHANHKNQEFINSMISDYGMSDIFRLTHGNERIFTHFNKKYGTASRLDFFLIDDNLVNFPVCSADISHGFKSDHSYISLNIQGSSITPGRGYWKFNNSHLLQDEFKSDTRAIVSDTVNSSFDSYRGLWDTIKFKIKDHAIRYGKKRKKESDSLKRNVQQDIERVKSTPNFMTDSNLRKQLFDNEIKLNRIIDQEVKGIITRSRVQWTEEGERSTKFFFGLEKSNGKKKSISKLISPDNGVLYDQQDISNHVVDFYQTLYRSTNPSSQSIDNYLHNTHFNTLDNSQSETLDDVFSITEIDVVVGTLKNNKSPGWDGLTSEFYKEFWDILRPILFKSFLESIDMDCMSPSQRIGIITLLPKPKTPMELAYIKNWRPITLLNVDYKIFTHVIKNRILKALPSIISNVQSGFQAGKSTIDNLILMSLTLEYFHNNPEEEGMLLQVDFEKAFDTVEHNFLFKTMEKLGFGNYIIKLVKVAFFGCMSYANINGYLSSPIYIFRGLHQGSPLSPILFLLVAQVCSTKLSLRQDIVGISVHGADIFLSLFADDTDIFVQATSQCIEAIVQELTVFGMLSGCKANVSKTRCTPLGKAKSNTQLLNCITDKFGVDFVQNSFTALGVLYYNDKSIDEIACINYNIKFEKAKNWVDIWSKRDLTLLGKVTLIKSLILSQFTYLAIPLPRPSSQVINRLNTLIFHFLWGCKRDKIKRDIVTRSREEGGLGLIYPYDFIISLKLTLFNKLFDKDFSHSWKNIVIKQLKYPNNLLVSVENGLSRKNCSFTLDLLDCYLEWRLRAVGKNSGFVDPCVWGNKEITGLWKKVLWNGNLINKGIYYISHFLSSDRLKSILLYDQFCTKWCLGQNDISHRDYSIIRIAIKDYCQAVGIRINYNLIDESVNTSCLLTARPSAPIKAGGIRNFMTVYIHPETLSPLKEWCRELQTSNIDWVAVFNNTFISTTNNYKLIQFQYKLLMRISTSRYMRYKMGIVKDNPNCLKCKNNIETLTHIFINCPHTKSFLIHLRTFILLKIDPLYRDNKCSYLITINHNIHVINYLNMAAKWYISKQFQQEQPLSWHEFKRFIRIALLGEKAGVKSTLLDTMF